MNVRLVAIPMDGTKEIVSGLGEEVRKLLHYSWRDIAFEYEGLTSIEKSAISKDNFENIVEWVRTAFGEEHALRPT